MNKYEESAKRIMERGDIILEKKRRRIIRISRTAGAVTGICAVFVIGFGIWNNTFLKESAKPPVIDDNSIIVPATEEITEGNTAYQEADVQKSSENKKTENNVTTEIIANEKTTKPAVSVTPSENQTSPANGGTTVTNAKQISVTSDRVIVTTVNSSASADTTAFTPLKTTVHTTSVITLSPIPPTTTVTTVCPVIESPVSPTTTVTNYHTDGGAAPRTTAVTKMPTAGSATPPPEEFVFGDDQIKYTISDHDTKDEVIDRYLGTLSEGVRVYSIVDVPIENAVMLDFYGEYYLYYNKGNTVQSTPNVLAR